MERPARSTLRDTILRARDLLDDARYLPGPEHTDLTYSEILASLQVIDASLEYIHLLVSLDDDNPYRKQFFSLLADYPETARGKFDAVAQQFDDPPRRDGPDRMGVELPRAVGCLTRRRHTAQRGYDPRRPVVIASCLDQIAAAITRISAVACEINARRDDH